MSKDTVQNSESETLPRVMLIEDSPTITKIISKQLTELGYGHLSSYTGHGGVDLLKENPDINILLLDLQLEKESGLDVMYQLKTQFKNDERSFYVIAQTAFDTEDMQHRCQNVGFSDFIGKPFTKDVLAEKLDKAIATLKV